MRRFDFFDVNPGALVRKADRAAPEPAATVEDVNDFTARESERAAGVLGRFGWQKNAAGEKFVGLVNKKARVGHWDPQGVLNAA